MKSLDLMGGLLAVSLLPLASLCGQDRSLAREVEFVRSLASQLRFISLAQSEVEALQIAHRDSDDFKLVSQLGIEISLIGAQTHPNRQERRNLFKDALDRSKEFIQRYEDEPVADAARLTMIRASYEFGVFLLEELELAREQAPDQIGQLENTAVQVYQEGVDACDEAMERLEHDRPEGSKNEQNYFMSWLYKGMLLRENAKAKRIDRDHLCMIAADTLEEMIFEMGENSILGMKAYFEMSQVAEVLGDYEGAVRDYRDTIDSIDKILSEGEDIPASAQELLFDLMQQAYGRAANALFLSSSSDEVLQFTQQFRDHVTSLGAEGADIYDIADHSVLLTEARAMAESGDAAKIRAALDQVREINKRHGNDFIGARAKSILKDILDAQSTMVSGSLLLEVAKGEYQAKNYEAAIIGLKRAYAVMDSIERSEKGLELWTLVGRSFGRLKRYLEASLALCDALEFYGDTKGSDPTYTADFLESTWNGYMRQAKSDNDSSLRLLNDRVTNLLGNFGGAGSEAKMLFSEGNRLLTEGQLDQAIDRFQRVAVDTPYYEPSQGRLVIASQRQGDFAMARKRIADYKAWLNTDAAKSPDGEPSANRGSTLAAIDYYASFMDYQEATGEGGVTKDATRYPAIIDTLMGFQDRHGRFSANFTPRVYDMVARLNAELGRIDRAEATYRTLRSEFPGSALIPMLATVIFTAHSDHLKSVEAEYQALLAAEDLDRRELADAEVELESARRAALNSGLDYTRSSPRPQYSVIWNSMLYARDLKDWHTVEDLGKKLIEIYAKDENYADRVERRVKEKLGEAYLRQGNYKSAVNLLAAAEQAAIDAKRPNYPLTRLLCLALGGWVEFDENGTRVIIAGLDKPDEAYHKYWNEYKKYALNSSRTEDYDINWYRFHWECYQFANRAIAKDSAFKARAGNLYGKAEFGEAFASLKLLGAEGKKLADLFLSYPPQ